jgi:hypothetical protein
MWKAGASTVYGVCEDGEQSAGEEEERQFRLRVGTVKQHQIATNSKDSPLSLSLSFCVKEERQSGRNKKMMAET